MLPQKKLKQRHLRNFSWSNVIVFLPGLGLFFIEFTWLTNENPVKFPSKQDTACFLVADICNTNLLSQKFDKKDLTGSYQQG